MENKVSWRLGKILDDRYEIVSVVGIGGMAVVYQAFDLQLKRDVAVKVLRDDVSMDAESRRQFSKEYQAVGKLSHPNIRAVYDVVSSGDTEYIVMEYVDGINLKQYMKKQGILSWQEVLHFSSQIARALSHAHSRGIIHLDIKPQNIMLPKDGTVKIADFGIAQMEETASPSGSTEEAVGSIHYISPEQARGESVDARSDIYSLGVVMYEMLTGRLPFDGKTVAEVAMQHYSVIPDAPGEINPDVPPELEAITLRAMQPEPDERYPTADDMLADLEDFRRAQSAAPSAPESEEEPEEEEEAERPSVPVSPAPSRRPRPQRRASQPVREVRDEIHVVTKNVPRISKSGELSREGYVRRRARAGSVSMLLGFAIVAAFAIGLFVFVWQYWLRDIFRDAERIEVASFIGLQVEDVTASGAMDDLYNFKVVYRADSNHEEGMIVEQDPAPGSSRMIVSDGIDVTITVSSGIQLVTIPEDIVNAPYTEVQVRLQALEMNVIITREQSSEITENYVIRSDPAPGSAVPSGSTVTVVVSAGPSASYTSVPNLVGMTKQEALLTLQREGLICGEGEIYYVSSSMDESGKVMWQNYSAGTQVVMGTPVYLQIGTGPTTAVITQAPVTENQDAAPAPEGQEAPPVGQ